MTGVTGNQDSKGTGQGVDRSNENQYSYLVSGTEAKSFSSFWLWRLKNCRPTKNSIGWDEQTQIKLIVT